MLDSSFNNPGFRGPTPLGDAAAPPGEATAATTPTASPATASPATERFHSCRWRKPAENGLPDHCTHRDVLPMAGTTGFVPDSWCADCGYYKAKRTPRKRQEEQPQQDSWRRW